MRLSFEIDFLILNVDFFNFFMSLSGRVFVENFFSLVVFKIWQAVENLPFLS
jgi:hypothetical protein